MPRPATESRFIPADLPFTVRTSWRRAAVLSLAVAVVWAAMLIGFAAWMLFSRIDSTRIVVQTIVAIGIGAAALFGLLLGLMAASGGPLAACDEHGLWLRARQFPARAFFLPWQAVDVVYTRRWGIQKVVCVRAHDPSVGSGMGLLAGIEQAQSKLFTGAGMIIPTAQADKRAPEILRAVARYSRGRCRVQAPNR